MGFMQDSASNILGNLQDNLVDNIIMIRLGLKAKAYIMQRVQRAEFLNGSTGGSQYSTTPMPIPYGLFVKKFGKSLLKKGGDKEKIIRGQGKIITTAKNDEFSVYRSKSGKTMVLISGGYKRWRELNKKNSSQVELTWSARMLRNLGVLRDESSSNSVRLGFTSDEENKKAYYQHVGAGKNKVKRIFMDLTEKEINNLADLAEKEIIKRLIKSLNNPEPKL